MTVSVIIPCFNQGEFLGEAIGSALAQTPRADEVIVVDDGSTDDTPEVAKQFAEIRYLRQENRGLSEARNAGFHASRGTFLLFLDSDDRLPAGAIESGLAALAKAPQAAFAYGLMRRMTIEGAVFAARREPERSDYYRDLLGNNYIPTPGMVLFRRATLEDVGLFDPSAPPAADYEMYLRIARVKPIVAHSALSLDRRVHPQAMTGNASRMLRSVLRVHAKQWPHVQHDKTLCEAYRRGREWWKQWYGEQLVTQLSVKLHLGQWQGMLAGVWDLLRYRPVRMDRLFVPARRSAALEFAYVPDTESRARFAAAISGPGRDGELRILAAEIAGLGEPRSRRALDGPLLATVSCENARLGTVALIDDVPLASVTLRPSLIQALIPRSLMAASDEHRMTLVG